MVFQKYVILYKISLSADHHVFQVICISLVGTEVGLKHSQHSEYTLLISVDKCKFCKSEAAVLDDIFFPCYGMYQEHLSLWIP